MTEKEGEVEDDLRIGEIKRQNVRGKGGYFVFHFVIKIYPSSGYFCCPEAFQTFFSTFVYVLAVPRLRWRSDKCFGTQPPPAS